MHTYPTYREPVPLPTARQSITQFDRMDLDDGIVLAVPTGHNVGLEFTLFSLTQLFLFCMKKHFFTRDFVYSLILLIPEYIYDMYDRERTIKCQRPRETTLSVR